MFLIEYNRESQKNIASIGSEKASQIFDKVYILEKSPFPHGYSKVKGHLDIYRLRVGLFRVIYRVDIPLKKIVILKIQKRDSVYNNL